MREYNYGYIDGYYGRGFDPPICYYYLTDDYYDYVDGYYDGKDDWYYYY